MVYISTTESKMVSTKLINMCKIYLTKQVYEIVRTFIIYSDGDVQGLTWRHNDNKPSLCVYALVVNGWKHQSINANF